LAHAPRRQSTTDTTNVNISNTAQVTFFGRSSDEADAVNGYLDEIRMKNLVLSADWITTEYNNQSDVATFWTIAEEGGGGGAANNATFFGGGM
jgi:hypothetical protein